MRFRTYEEATSFVKALLDAKNGGKRALLTAKMDSVPQWQAGKTPEPKLDGSRIVAIYMAYKAPTAKQKKEAQGAKLAGVSLQQIEGRLVDVRQVADGTCQVLFTNGLRNADGSIPWRGPNVDKGILCYLAVDEGIGEPVDDILARVPAEMVAKLKALKDGKAKLTFDKVAAQKKLEAILQAELDKNTMPEKVAVKRATSATIEVAGADPQAPDEKKLKLK